MTAQLPTTFKPLFTPSRYKASWGGRGSAKSRSFGRAALIRGATEPLRILCCREIQKSIADSVKRVLDDDIHRLGLSHFYNSTKTHIYGQNGTVILFSGLRTNPDSIKSMEGLDLALVEEANKVSQRSLDLLIPTLRKENSEIWFAWNPELPTDPVDKMFRGPHGAPPGSILMPCNWDKNPWFPKVLRDEMDWDKRRDKDKYLHIWEGHYLRNSEARVFKNWVEEPFETPSDAMFYYGADWGFSIDPTVLIRCFIDHAARKLFIDHEAWSIKCEIEDTPALFDTVPLSRKYRIRADSARPETISYMNRQQFRIIPAKKGAGSVEEGVKFLQNYDIVVHPKCRHVIDELLHYSYKVDPHTNDVTSVLEDKKNHTIDALRYALEQVRLKSHFAT